MGRPGSVRFGTYGVLGGKANMLLGRRSADPPPTRPAFGHTGMNIETRAPQGAKAGSGRMEQIITGIINVTVIPMANLITWLVSSGVALVLFAVLWIAFGVAIVTNQGGLDAAWAWLRDQHIIVQGLAWLLFLPVTIGLWIWETGWPFLLRLVLVGGLAFWSILIFMPKAAPKA